MYRFKNEKYDEVKNKFKAKYIADEIGISETYVSLILNNKTTCSKTVAYCMVKIIDSNAELKDYFEIV